MSTPTKPAPKKAKLPTLGDVVAWFGLRAAAAAICDKLSRGGDRKKLQVGRGYPVSLRVTGMANGKAIDVPITGRLIRDADRDEKRAPKGADLLAEALACFDEPERGKVAQKLKKGTAKKTEATEALATQIIEARRTPATRTGDVRMIAAS